MMFIKTRKIPIIMILILLFVGVYSYYYQESELIKLMEERELLEMEIARLELIKAELEEELRNSDSKEFFESVAINRYSMVQPNDIIYYVMDEGN